MSHAASSSIGPGDDSASSSFLPLVVCEICFRDFLPADPSLIVPFCVSSCAHIFCHEHRTHAAQCPVCRREGVSVEQLTSEPSGPIAHYFSSVSSTIRLADEASVFQLAHLKKILRFFKDRVIKQRDVLNEVRTRLEASMKTAERVTVLERENARLVAELDRGGQQSAMPPPPLPPLVNGTYDQRKRRRDGNEFASPGSSSSGHRQTAPARFTLPLDTGQPSQPQLHQPGSSGRQSRSEAREMAGGVGNLQQFAYQPPPDRSRASTPRRGPSAVPPHKGYDRVDFSAPPSFFEPSPFRVAPNKPPPPLATPRSERIHSSRPQMAPPSRAGTSHAVRESASFRHAVQPMPVQQQQQRPSTSRTVFSNNPEAMQQPLPRGAFVPLRPQQRPPQPPMLTARYDDPAHLPAVSSASSNRVPFDPPATPRRGVVPSYEPVYHDAGGGSALYGGGYAGGTPARQAQGQRPTFHQAGRG